MTLKPTSRHFVMVYIQCKARGHVNYHRRRSRP